MIRFAQLRLMQMPSQRNPNQRLEQFALAPLTALSDRYHPVKHGKSEAESRASTHFSTIRYGLSYLTQAIYTEFLPYVYPRD